MSNYLDRTVSVLGEDHVKKIQDCRVLVVGLGGVGGTALSALYRSGFRKFVLVDNDVVDASNLNRQLMYDTNDVSKKKTELCKEKLLEFCGDFDIKTFDIYVDSSNVETIFSTPVDIVVDAIDFVPGKIAIYKYCLEHNIPFISSLGMAKRLDPEKVIVTTLNKTENDPLARKIRYEARQCELDPKKIPVVFSKETPITNGRELGSMMMVPSTAGLLIAKFIINSVK